MFLGGVLKAVMQGLISLQAAVDLYEREMMPRAKRKQEISFLNGEIWQLSGKAAERRDAAMTAELGGDGRVQMRTPNLFGDPGIMREIYSYSCCVCGGERTVWEGSGRRKRLEDRYQEGDV